MRIDSPMALLVGFGKACKFNGNISSIFRTSFSYPLIGSGSGFGSGLSNFKGKSKVILGCSM
jgi:hypothetical protein